MSRTYKDLFGDGYTTYNDDGTTSHTSKDLFGDGYTTYNDDGSSSHTTKDIFGDGYTTYGSDGSSSHATKDLFGDGYTTYGSDGSYSRTYKDMFGDGYSTYGSGAAGYSSTGGLGFGNNIGSSLGNNIGGSYGSNIGSGGYHRAYGGFSRPRPAAREIIDFSHTKSIRVYVAMTIFVSLPFILMAIACLNRWGVISFFSPLCVYLTDIIMPFVLKYIHKENSDAIYKKASLVMFCSVFITRIEGNALGAPDSVFIVACIGLAVLYIVLFCLYDYSPLRIALNIVSLIFMTPFFVYGKEFINYSDGTPGKLMFYISLLILILAETISVIKFSLQAHKNNKIVRKSSPKASKQNAPKNNVKSKAISQDMLCPCGSGKKYKNCCGRGK